MFQCLTQRSVTTVIINVTFFMTCSEIGNAPEANRCLQCRERKCSDHDLIIWVHHYQFLSSLVWITCWSLNFMLIYESLIQSRILLLKLSSMHNWFKTSGIRHLVLQWSKWNIVYINPLVFFCNHPDAPKTHESYVIMRIIITLWRSFAEWSTPLRKLAERSAGVLLQHGFSSDS